MELPRTFGRYVLLASLGKGAAGEAFLARPWAREVAGVPTPVVIKLLHQKLAGEAEFVKRFRHEAEIAVRVTSRHVATTYDVGAVGDSLYIALQYVAGFTLARVFAKLLQAAEPPPIRVATAMVLQCLSGLADLYGATDEEGRALEVIHRDISPKNIMVGDEGRLRLIDLGLGKSKAQDWKTRDGRVMGSPGYMPPEQILGEPVDHRADVYAIGVVAYELFAFERWIEPQKDPVQMLRVALEKPFTPPSARRPEVPRAIDEIVRRAMAPKREDRFASAAELRDALASAGRAASEEEVARFVGSVLGRERDRRRADVARLLEMTAEPEPDNETTVVMAMRSRARDDLQSAARSKRARAPVLAAVVVVALGLGWAAGIMTQQSDVEVRIVAQPAPEPAPEKVLPVAKALAEPEAEIVEGAPRVVSRSARKTKRSIALEPPRPSPPPSPTIEQRLSALDERARRMWQALAPEDPRRDAVAKLLRDLSMTKASLARISDADAKLRALEQRFDALEQRE